MMCNSEYYLRTATKWSNIETVNWILQTFPETDIYSCNEYDENAIMVSCIHKKFEILKLLSKTKKKFRFFNKDLICACIGGNLDIVKYILNFKKHKFSDETFNIAFSYACQNGHYNVVKYLLLIKNIDICFDNHYAFKKACETQTKTMFYEHQSIDVINLLVELVPFYKYEIIKNKHNKSNHKYKPIILDNLNLKNTIKISNIDDCSICYSNKSNILTNCKHQFCDKCIYNWTMNIYDFNVYNIDIDSHNNPYEAFTGNEYFNNKHATCPYCREILIFNKMFNIEQT